MAGGRPRRTRRAGVRRTGRFDATRPGPVPGRRLRGGAAGHGCRPALRLGRPRCSSPTCSARARRAAVGRAVARHPPERPGHAATAARSPTSRAAPLPAQGARRRRAAVAAGPPDADAGAGRVRRRALPGPEPKPELLCALTPFERVLRGPSGRRHARPARRARRRRAGRRRCATHGPGGTLAALTGERSRRADHRRVPQRATARRRRGSRAARRALPRRPERGRDAAAQPRPPAPGEAIQLGPGNLHAYLGGAGIELMGASDNVVRGGLTTSRSTSTTSCRRRPDAARPTR